jgi:RNA polymerase sigma factor for flagellar operon FliA
MHSTSSLRSPSRSSNPLSRRRASDGSACSPKPTAATDDATLSPLQRALLVKEHLSLVAKIARRIHASCPHSVTTLEDLVGYGSIGLIEASKRYDPRLGGLFTTFAFHRIRGAIIDGIETSNWYSRHEVRNYRKAIDGAESRKPFVTVILTGRSPWSTSLNEAAQPTLVPCLASTPDEDDDDTCSKLVPELPAILATLPTRERRVVELHYFQGLSLAEAGRRMNVSPTRACRLHMMALALLREAFEAKRSLDD